MENYFYTKSVSYSEIKKLLKNKSLVRGFPQYLKQVFTDETRKQWTVEQKTKEEYYSDVKQFIYIYFAYKGYNCSKIAKWNKNLYVNI